MSNNNYNPKLRPVENSAFSKIGRGNWATQENLLLKVIDWKLNPWELVSNDWVSQNAKHLNSNLKSKSSKVSTGDHIDATAIVNCGSSTDLSALSDASYDLVVTDPPFGGILQYAELADFFHVWLSH